MKWASVPSAYRKVILRDSVRTGRNFSPARNVLSMTAPSSERFSFVRTNAPPLPGLTCWNSTILKTVPSTSMWAPFLNWLVLIMRPGRLAADPRCSVRRRWGQRLTGGGGGFGCRRLRGAGGCGDRGRCRRSSRELRRRQWDGHFAETGGPFSLSVDGRGEG